MIYSNVEVCAEVEETEKGDRHYILVGEYGPGRKPIKIACSEGTVIKQGMNPEFTVTLLKGRAFIAKKQDRNLYMLLSSKGGYTSRSDGMVLVLAEDADKIFVMAKGNGGDGLITKVGNWDCVLLKVKNPLENLTIQVQPAGLSKKYPQTLYMLEEEVVYTCDINMMKRMSDMLQVDPMCEINTVKSGALCFGKEWVKL